MQRTYSPARIGRTCTVSTSFCSFSDGRRGGVFMSREHNKTVLVCPAKSYKPLPSDELVRSVYSSWGVVLNTPRIRLGSGYAGLGVSDLIY